ncbi:ComEC/Rec2 family competence protein [Tepidibacillus fermentans]|uniref:Beta-lactamase superfamily II metal-dependent hydrolase n=1 Tax=Tepidibacillus fermentans TaxID=1281767 RepID=A0A4R3KB31_9BACI|nr:ComEC/Rec2 family competence protein [Tepidibacillus fermentans]TCS80344.1 beta-lactamase superfamily II metal-dependent hydrolase [Tepidibacillus fermentans]
MGYIVALLILIALPYYVYLEAQKRGMNSILWFVGSILFPIIVPIVFFITKRKISVSQSANYIPPGFRSKKLWKMGVAGFAYLILVSAVFAAGRAPSIPTSEKTSTVEKQETTNTQVVKSIQTNQNQATTTNTSNGTPVSNEPTTTTNEPTPTGKLEVRFLNVGQGDATLVKFPSGKVMLVDGGNNQYGQAVVNYIKDAGVKSIDIMVATHPDADHIGGLDVVLQNFVVKKFYAPKVANNTKSYEDMLLAVKNEGIGISSATAGVKLDVGAGATAEMVGPIKNYGSSDMNNNSAVIRIVHGSTSFLLTGDAEIESESDMIASGKTLKSTVLKVGHHGSKSSTSLSFLNAVSPSYAVISVGHNNYGHPTTEILNRLSSKGIKIFRTDKQGTIIATSNGSKVVFNSNPMSYAPTKVTTTTSKPKSTTTNKTDTKTTTSSGDCSKPLIKGNISSSGEKIYHVPGGAYYDRTIAEEMFCTEEQAIKAGYRKSKR